MPELTVASTTDTEAEVKRAANVPEAPEAEVTELEQEPKAQTEEQPEEPKPAKNSFQKRIDRLTRDKSEAERRAKFAEDRLKELETIPQQLPDPEEQVVTLPPPNRIRPKPDDVDKDGKAKYATYEDFIEDLADWKAEQRDNQRQAEQAKRDWESQQATIRNNYNRQVTDFKKEHPDFDAVVNSEILIPQVALDTIIELANPAISYYLGQHPEVCDELAKNVTRPGWVAARIGQIGAMNGNSVPVQEEAEEQEPPPVRRSSAPPPIKPVGGSSTKSSVPLDEMPYSEYRKLRDQQAKARYRR